MDRRIARQLLLSAVLTGIAATGTYAVLLLRGDPSSALPVLLALAAGVILYLLAGMALSPPAVVSFPERVLTGYLRWASYRTSRFLSQLLLLVTLLAAWWTLGVQSAYQFTVRCGACETVSAPGFLDRELRQRCQQGLARLILYRPLHSSAVVMNSIRCLDARNLPYPALWRRTGLLQCAEPVSGREPLTLGAAEPAELQVGRILRYRLHGRGLTRATTLDVDHATFVGSSATGVEDRLPAAVDEAGRWADFYIYLASSPEAGETRLALRNEFAEAAEGRLTVRPPSR